MRKLVLAIWFLLGSVMAKAAVYDVRAYGACPDDDILDSDSINMAIKAASEAGGGTVLIPSGRYLCYSIHLCGDIELHLEEGAVLIAATPTEQDGFDSPEPAICDKYSGFGHNHIHNSLIWGENLDNVTISGPGMIDGSALDSWTEGFRNHGNKAIAMRLCTNVSLKDFTIFRGGHFAVHMTGVDNLEITGLTVDSDRDGLDILCCRNVRIIDCRVNTPEDDSIVLKSPYVLGYARDVENVTIDHCSISGYMCGTLLDGTLRHFPAVNDQYRSGGRIKLGTESSGGYRNVRVSNCDLSYCGGLILESEDGGVMRNVSFENITIADCLYCPIFIRLGARMRSPEGTPIGKVKNISFKNISVEGAESWNSCIITGLSGYRVRNISLKNVSIRYTGGFTAEDADIVPPEFEKDYPEPWMFGTVPAKGFFIRHAENVRFKDVRFLYENPDGRPLFKASDCRRICYKRTFEECNDTDCSCLYCERLEPGTRPVWKNCNPVMLERDGISNNSMEFRCCFDSDSLYLRFDVMDTMLNADVKEKDHPALFLDDMVEILFDAGNVSDGWTTDCSIYHVNILGCKKDDRGTEDCESDPLWDGTLSINVQIRGTINDNSDSDEGYTVCLSVPWTEIGITPQHGRSLAVNFGFGDNDRDGRRLVMFRQCSPTRTPSCFGRVFLR